MLQQITIRVELGPYVLRGREVEVREVHQAVGDHTRCELAFMRDPKAVASEVSALRVGELAAATLRVIFVADGVDECLAFEGRVRDADIDHLATGAGHVTVLALSESYTLAEHVDRQYLREQTVPALAGRLGVRVVGALPAGAGRDYVQAGTSAWAFLAQVAAEEGLQLRARWPRTPDGAAGEPAELARGFADQTHTVTWGRELLRLSTTLTPVNAGVTGAFYDPAEKHDHRFRGVRASVSWLGGAAPVVAAAKDVATRDADGGDPGHLEVGRVGGVRARTLTEFRDRLELESARRTGSAVRARGASVVPALRAGDRIDISAAELFAADVSGGELADRTGVFGLTSVVHRWSGTLYENAFTATPWSDYHPTPARTAAPAGRADGGPALGAGLTLAVVVDNADPKARGRVRVRFAYMSEGEQSHWIRVAGLGGGNTRGLGVLPSKGDEVVVAAVAGDPEHPVVLGALWNGVDRASHAPGRQVWITPAGNTLVFLEGEPGDGAETVELYSREGNTWVQLAQKGPTGVPTVTVHSEGDLALEAPKGEVRLTAKSYLAHVTEDHATQAGGAYTVKSTGAYTVESGARVALKAGGDLVTLAGGTLRAHAGGVHTLTGSQVTQNPPGASAPTVAAVVPAAGPSAWEPRAVPGPGPGRSTEDPVTPTQKALAAKAARASLAAPADATRVTPAAPAPSMLARARASIDPRVQAAEYERLEAERQAGTVADKVRRRAERAALVARGQALGAQLPGVDGRELTTAADRLKQFSHDVELARLSRDVYRLPGSGGAPPLGWTRLSDDPSQLPAPLNDPALWRDTESGFVAGLYRSAPELGGETVLAFRGTAEKGGILTDGAQAFGLKTDQYDRAAQLSSIVRRKYGPEVLTTGHSLGGGLAGAASTIAGLRGAVFNPAGVHSATLAEYGTTRRAGEDLVKSYHVRGEILSSAQSPLGRLVLSPLANVVKSAVAVGSAIGQRRMPTLREVTPIIIPGPLGSRVVLPNVAAAEVPLLTAGMRHTSIFPIQGMEQQKESDRSTIESAQSARPSANRHG